MTSENLQHTAYRDPYTKNVRLGNTILPESGRDMDQYSRPLERIHNSSLHGWGVAAGLGVTATLNNPDLTVLPGVAVDNKGQHISLAVGGNAEVGSSPDGFLSGATLTPITTTGVVIHTTNLTGDKYLTIQFWETFDSDSYQSGVFRYFHTPWIQLVDVAGFTNDGNHLVLTKVTINAGQVTALTQDLRQGTDLPVGSIHLQKSVTTSPTTTTKTVQATEAGVIRAYSGGGIDITVPNPTDEVHLERDDGGNFAKISLGAEKIVARQGNGTTESVVIDTELGSITSNGSITANGIVSNSDITITGNITATGTIQGANLVSSGNVTASNGTVSASNMTASGAIQGGSITSTGNITATGTIQGANLVSPGNITASGNVGIGTATPSAKLTVDPQGPGGIVIGNPNTGQGGFTSLLMEISAASGGHASLQAIKASGTEWGDIAINPHGGNVTTNGTMTSGGSGSNGEIIVNNAQNQPTIVLNGGISTVEIGGSGANTDGVLEVLRADGQAFCAIYGSSGQFKSSSQTTGAAFLASVSKNGIGVSVSASVDQNTIYQAALASKDYAAYFNGPVTMTGPVTKPGGAFKIDHPLDPSNKYLLHSFVESPEMKNVYDGVVVLDAHGEARVELPAWFEALNKDFRYQLTCIGGHAPVYIAEKVQNNHFKIAGGSPDLEVSWQVTGIRKDAWANAYRVPVEENKSPVDRGHYLHPELYGASEERRIQHIPHTESAPQKETIEVR